MRYARQIILAVVGALGVVGCQSIEPTVPVSLNGQEAARVQAAIERWPTVSPGAPGLRRPFFATIHAAGRRTTASGIMQYYGPRDFRITAVTELGVVLFDGRVNWAGVTVLRHVSGLDEPIVDMLLRDMSRAFELPPNLDGLSIGASRIVLTKTLADTHRYTWTFDAASGLLRTADIDLGAFDTLHIDYRSYDARGWPEEVHIIRKARLFDVAFTFTDTNNVVQNEWKGTSEPGRGSAQ
jgi:hypothetical protein